MKVGTDGVLLGALAAIPAPGGRILDIGTGTGLIALMLAQRSTAQIDAVELDAGAAVQAGENVLASPWAGRIRVIHSDFLDFYPACEEKYGLIVSNPPYFRNSLLPEGERKALARHGSEGFFSGLLTGTARLLLPEGRCCLILPAEAAGRMLRIAAQAGLYLRSQVNIRSRENHKVIRTVLTLGKSYAGNEVSEEQLVIYRGRNEYTAAFIELLQDFYLNL